MIRLYEAMVAMTLSREKYSIDNTVRAPTVIELDNIGSFL